MFRFGKNMLYQPRFHVKTSETEMERSHATMFTITKMRRHYRVHRTNKMVLKISSNLVQLDVQQFF